MYLTFEEYQNMGGTLDETAFANYEFEAENFINWYTFNRLKKETKYPEAVKRCVFKLIDIAVKKQQAFSLEQDVNGDVSSAIVSQSNDGVSISYNVLNASQAFDVCKSEIKETVSVYLYGVKNSLGRSLLYRGVYPGE